MSIQIPLARLRLHCDPLSGDPWNAGVTRQSVDAALVARRLNSTPSPIAPCAHYDHAGRIAWLVEHPATDAIDIDVGVPALGLRVGWLVTDGNHRLAAAIYAQREIVHANVTGQLDWAYALFGVDCDDEKP